MTKGGLEKRAAMFVGTVLTRRPAILSMAHAQRPVLPAGRDITATKVNTILHNNYVQLKKNPNLCIQCLKLKKKKILACSAGFYGLRCKTTCSPYCTDPSSCDHVTGSCMADCQDGWQGDNCETSESVSINLLIKNIKT